MLTTYTLKIDHKNSHTHNSRAERMRVRAIAKRMMYTDKYNTARITKTNNSRHNRRYVCLNGLNFVRACVCVCNVHMHSYERWMNCHTRSALHRFNVLNEITIKYNNHLNNFSLFLDLLLDVRFSSLASSCSFFSLLLLL